MVCLHLRNLFKRKEPKTDFDFDSATKYIPKHSVEGRITTYRCYNRQCRYTLSVYRCLSQSSKDVDGCEESIRLEQSIEKATGKVTKEVKVWFGINSHGFQRSFSRQHLTNP